MAALGQLDGGRLVAIVDTDHERLGRLGESLQIATFSAVEALVGVVDAVWVCTPPALHAQQATLLADHGIHIFCEKPFTLNLLDADQVIAVCGRRGAHLMIGHVMRYLPETQLIRRLAIHGELGQPVRVFGKRLTMSNIMKRAPWVRDGAQSGGFALESGIHEIDTVRFLGGEVASVAARVRYDDPRSPQMDTDFRALFRLCNGAAGEVAASDYSPFDEWAWGLVGTRGAAITRGRGEVSVTRVDGPAQTLSVEPHLAYGPNTSLIAEDQAFVDSIRTDTAPPIPGEEGRRNVEVALAAYRASREDRVISLE